MIKLHQPRPVHLLMKAERPRDGRRRSVLLGLGSLMTTQLLAGCGGGGGGASASAANQSSQVHPSGTSAAAASAGASSTSSSTAAASGSASSTATASTNSSTTSSKAPTSTSSTSSTTATTTPAASALITGVFSGGFDPTTAEAYEKWLGKPTAYNVDYLTNDNTGWDIAQWAPMRTAQPSTNMLYSVPLNDMAGIVAGNYDAVYQSMASQVAAAYPSAIIRIGWEMNGSWYAWAAANVASTYIQAYNRVAAFFRAKSSKFMIEWCPNNGVAANMDCEQAYPGDTYVDCIGMDTYMDYRYGGTETSAARWSSLVSNGRGLQWQVNFAQQHGKKMSTPEWGVNSDDPQFIENMHSWFTTYKYHHASYWDSNSDFQGQLSGNQYPNAGAAFKSLFG